LAAGPRRTFPLLPRRRFNGLPLGELPSRRRGSGSDIIGHRPYAPGDPVTTIDWFASARLATASGQDVFVVRDHAADEAPRVVIVVDRRPAMGLYPQPLPWLNKRTALLEAVAAVTASAAVARADTAALDFAAGEAWWLPPGRRDRGTLIAARESGDTPFAAPDDTLARSLEFLSQHRGEVPVDTFVFILSDFLERPPHAAWMRGITYGWDLVPVVIQDPVWEQSFPAVGGIGLPIIEPGAGADALIRLSRRQAASRREANERRFAELIGDCRALGLEPVLIGTSDPDRIDTAFMAWAEQRGSHTWAR
jgi:uncharacterized protein (DUF58 family)